jgi:hypothetical protein
MLSFTKYLEKKSDPGVPGPTHLLSVDELIKDDVRSDDPGDGDHESSPDGHVCDAPAAEQDRAHRFASERLREHVRKIPERSKNILNMSWEKDYNLHL